LKILPGFFFRRNFLGVKKYGLGILPDPGISAPAFRVGAFGFLIDLFPDFEDFRMLSPVALPRGNEAYGAMMVFFVVPLHEVPGPEP